MGIIEALAGSAAGAILQRLTRGRSTRVALNVVGQPPFGRLPNYFLPGVHHPTELRGSELAGHCSDAYDNKYTDWIAKNHGAPCGSTRFTITVQCIGAANVALVRGRISVERLEPVFGIIVCHQSGGPIDGFHLHIDLHTKVIQCVPAESYPGHAKPIPLSFQIAPHTTEKFDVYATGGKDAVAWHLELDFIVDGKLVTKKVFQPSGEQFVTIPIDYDHAKGTFYPSGTGWIKAEPQDTGGRF